MNAVQRLVEMSKYAGARFDLVQGGGGNASVKCGDGTMIIKASGVPLSEVEENSGFVRVDNRKILKAMEALETGGARRRDRLADRASRGVAEAVMGGGGRPSIEVFLHALLGCNTLHVHPVAVNALLCRGDWKVVIGELFPGDSLSVEYRTPGVELALALRRELISRGSRRPPSRIFLQSHGVIVTSSEYGKIQRFTEDLLPKSEQRAGLDLARYRLATPISDLVFRTTGKRLVACLCEDREVVRLLRRRRSLFFAIPPTPDARVFCGMGAVEVGGPGDAGPVAAYAAAHREPPRLVLLGDLLFLIAGSVRRAREVEDVLKGNLMTAVGAARSLRPLPEEELRYLGGWEAEKYRQK